MTPSTAYAITYNYISTKMHNYLLSSGKVENPLKILTWICISHFFLNFWYSLAHCPLPSSPQGRQLGEAPMLHSPMRWFKPANLKPAYFILPCFLHGNHNKGSCPHSPLTPSVPWCPSVLVPVPPCAHSWEQCVNTLHLLQVWPPHNKIQSNLHFKRES